MDEATLATGTVVANNYRVTTRLGAGGMGTVYLAENLTLNQRVVVKVLRGAQVGAGHEEAQLLASLQHPNVVTVFAHDPARDLIVMEFLDGTSLSALLEKGIDRVNAIRVALAVAEALAAVHKRGLVHRDIKPENVMLALNNGGGRLVDWLKLIDFGVALKVGKAPPSPLGTPEFCPPEQFQRGAPAQPANDVYALGVTLYLLITGRFPFEGDVPALLRHHQATPPPSLVETLVAQHGDDAFDPRTRVLLEDLDDLVRRMLAKRPEERPSASDVARTLTRLESSFADAGTFVGRAEMASFHRLEPVRPRPLAVSQRAPAVPAPSPDSVITQERPALEPRPRRSNAAHAAQGQRSVEPPPPTGPVAPPADPADPAAAQLTDAELDAVGGGGTRRLQVVLGLVVVALAAALGLQIVTSEADVTPPATKVDVTPKPPVAEPVTLDAGAAPVAADPSPTPPPQVALDAGAVEATPDASVAEALADAGPAEATTDAGAASAPGPATDLAPDEPEPLATAKPGTKKGKVGQKTTPPCTFTGDSRAKYLADYDALRSRATTASQKAAIEDLEDRLSQAIKDQNCVAAEGVLRRMGSKLKK